MPTSGGRRKTKATSATSAPSTRPLETVETQAELELDVEIGGDGAPAAPLDWPSDLKPRAQAVRAVMTHADEPLTVDPDSGRDQHFHRTLNGVKKYAERLRHAPAGPTCGSCWRGWRRWGTWR